VFDYLVLVRNNHVFLCVCSGLCIRSLHLFCLGHMCSV
jgi:hypothetical protein